MRKLRSGKWNVKLIKLICEHIVVIYILLCVNVNKLVFSLAAFLKSVCTLAFKVVQWSGFDTRRPPIIIAFLNSTNFSKKDVDTQNFKNRNICIRYS